MHRNLARLYQVTGFKGVYPQYKDDDIDAEIADHTEVEVWPLEGDVVLKVSMGGIARKLKLCPDDALIIMKGLQESALLSDLYRSSK